MQQDPYKKPRGGWTCRNRPTIYEYFHNKYEVMPNGCWEWTGSRTPKGYGTGWAKAVKLAATHVSLGLHGRPRPFPTAQALHSCDNPPCVNPDHLRWGTNRDNVDDKISRGRHRKNYCPNGHEYTDENSGFYSGKRRCRICMKAGDRRSKAKKRLLKEK